MKKVQNALACMLLLMAGISTSANAQQAKKFITVSGKIKFPPSADQQQKFPFRVQKQVGDDRVTIDTIHLKADGTYSIKIDATRPQFYILNEFEEDRLTIWAGKDNLKIDFRGEDTAAMKIKNPPYVFIEGSQENNLVNDINFINYRNYQAMIETGQLQYRASLAKDTMLERLLGEHMNWLYDDMEQRVKLIIKMNQHTPVLMYALDFLSPRRDKDLILAEVNRLSKAYPWLEEAKSKKVDMAKAEAIAKKTAIGVAAMDFSQKNVEGKAVKLSDYRGKYVLLDFWASWCGPCRAENPNVLDNYEKYHNKGLEILGVSLDDKKDAWVKAIKDDGLTWAHVSDLKGWKNVVAQEYNIRAVPSNFLIDKDGKILAVNLRGEELSKKLEEIFGK
ncbi:peroxiredoxin [Chitinophaga niastensis]|uniref:Peroxiredoxin n=1 Tax=Chitinophaga niastensis TaxID=536980 RepID=A0A2P8HJ18_CHINA|nr:TlpA disulfide reductase family protein [Chitinophaga niastensis]PSL46195.1 peroxiredoxin [Chitinophaga niastensis]